MATLSEFKASRREMSAVDWAWRYLREDWSRDGDDRIFVVYLDGYYLEKTGPSDYNLPLQASAYAGAIDTSLNSLATLERELWRWHESDSRQNDEDGPSF